MTTQTTTTSSETYTLSSLSPTSSYTITTASQQSIYYLWTLGNDSQHCINDEFSFHADPGQAAIGTIAADKPRMAVYLLSDEQNTAWGNQGYCDPAESGIGIQWSSGGEMTQQANIRWTATKAGEYWFVIETFSGAPVVVTVNITIQTPLTTTQALYSTQYSTGNSYFSQTFTSVIVQEILPLGGRANLIIAVGIVSLVAVALLGFIGFTRRRNYAGRRKSSAWDTSPYDNVVPAPPPGARLCVYCGKDLAAGAKFCRKCGAQQPW